MTQANPSGTTETKTETPKVEVTLETPGALAALPPAESGEQWQRLKDQALSILAELPAYLSSFFSEYQKPIVTLGLIFAGGITIKVLLAAIDALNDIPLLAPTFELIGIGYSAWFVYRYLLRASNRQELLAEVNALKEQVFGKKF